MWGLNDKEVAVLEKYLKPVYGVAASQEVVMQLTMDPQIANFDIREANKLRKGIAKKVPKIIEETRQMFYQKGVEAGTRKEMLDYVWKRQIGMSLG
jgi:DNA polymerase-3 subunit alpha